MNDTYDELTLELERIETLALFLEDRLSDMSETAPCYALSLIARNIADRCNTEIREKVNALLADGKRSHQSLPTRRTR